MRVKDIAWHLLVLRVRDGYLVQSEKAPRSDRRRRQSERELTLRNSLISSANRSTLEYNRKSGSELTKRMNSGGLRWPP